MGMILTLRRVFQPHMVDLVRQERQRLEKALGGLSYELLDEGKSACRVVTDGFAVEFVWMSRERWIDADIEVHDVRDHPLQPHAKYSARQWLEARGLPTLPRRSGDMSLPLLLDELALVERVVADILSVKHELRQALFYLAGFGSGYNDRVLVPEQGPPTNIHQWANARFRQLPKWES